MISSKELYKQKDIMEKSLLKEYMIYKEKPVAKVAYSSPRGAGIFVSC
jgi:hypothetical protein